MPKQEVYHSSTLGPIPLSFTGRHLMQNLREAFQELLRKSAGVVPTPEWQNVSKARGQIAKYISELENKQVPQSMLDELARLRSENEQLRKWNANAMFGKLAPATQSATVLPLVLPPIPEGYALTVVGQLITIAPIEK